MKKNSWVKLFAQANTYLLSNYYVLEIGLSTAKHPARKSLQNNIQSYELVAKANKNGKIN